MSQLHHATGQCEATFGGITHYETKAKIKATFLSSKAPRAWLCAHLREASVVSTARYREKCGKALIFYQMEPTRESKELTRLKTQTQREASHLLLHNRSGQIARQKSCTMWENSRSKTQLTLADGNKSTVSQVSQGEAGGDLLRADKRAGLRRSRSSLVLLMERGERCLTAGHLRKPPVQHAQEDRRVMPDRCPFKSKFRSRSPGGGAASRGGLQAAGAWADSSWPHMNTGVLRQAPQTLQQ